MQDAIKYDQRSRDETVSRGRPTDNPDGGIIRQGFKGNNEKKIARGSNDKYGQHA